MGITEQNIKDYITTTGQPMGEYTSVWAVKMPSVINMALFRSVAVLFDMKYNILNVSEHGIMLIGVDGAGRLTPIHVWLSKENIKGIRMKKGMLSYDVLIEVEAGVLKYHVNKIMIGSGFQKANFEQAVQRLEKLTKK